MASSAIIRRRSVISNYLKTPTRSIQPLQSLLGGHGSRGLDSECYILYSEVPSAAMVNYSISRNSSTDEAASLAAKDQLVIFPGYWHFRQRWGITLSDTGIGQNVNLYSPGKTWMLHPVRTASTAAAKQQELGSDDEDNEEMITKKRKEPSPEECDQAVAGLSYARAKAKAKELQNSQRLVSTVLNRVWATLLGIGPALRAVASMSRWVLFQAYLILSFKYFPL